MWGIDVDNITKKVSLPRGRSELIFENFNLKVRQSEVVGIFGPNGCGKTTLLNMIAGIAKPDAGEISIFGEKPGAKRVAYIFQDYRNSLFPWLTLKDNITFPLSLGGMKRRDMDRELDRMVETLRMPFDLNRYPYQLSGGQQQYISIVRGLIARPAAMLIDEPFSALDYSNGLWLMEKLAEILDSVKIAAIIVAHDIHQLSQVAGRVCFLAGKPTRVMEERPIKTGGGLDGAEMGRIRERLTACRPEGELSRGWGCG